MPTEWIDAYQSRRSPSGFHNLAMACQPELLILPVHCLPRIVDYWAELDNAQKREQVYMLCIGAACAAALAELWLSRG